MSSSRKNATRSQTAWKPAAKYTRLPKTPAMEASSGCRGKSNSRK
jgi:hypothetical protein